MNHLCPCLCASIPPSDAMEVMTFTTVNVGPIKEGDDVSMKCETDGNPQPEFDFLKAVSD